MAFLIGAVVLIALGTITWRLNSARMNRVFENTDRMGMTREQALVYFSSPGVRARVGGPGRLMLRTPRRRPTRDMVD